MDFNPEYDNIYKAKYEQILFLVNSFSRDLEEKLRLKEIGKENISEKIFILFE